MGLFRSLANIFRKKVKEIDQAVKDPIADGEAAIEDSEKQVANFQEQIAKLLAKNKQTERNVSELEADVAKYEIIATNALKAGNEDAARQALEIQGQKEKVLATLKGEVQANEKLIEGLRAQLNTARSRIDQAKSNKFRLEARLEGAKIREGLAEASSSLSSNNSPFAALDDLEKVVDEVECRAEAKEELVGQEPANVAANLEEQFLKESSNVDDRLAKLKAKIDQN